MVVQHSYDIKPLLKVGVQRWFEVEPKPDDLQAAIEKLNNAIAEGIVDPDLRLVALQEDVVIARFAARIDPNGRFYFWAPMYGRSLPSNVRSEVAQSFLRYFEDSRAMQQVKFLETKPADDVPYLDEWLAILTANDFQETACAHLFDYYVSERQPVVPAETRVSLVPATSLSEEVIDGLIQECDRETLDRVDAQHQHPSDHWNEIKRSRQVLCRPQFSHAAVLNDQPAGVVLGGRELGIDDGWILYVGVVPAFRRQHIGTQLLDRALHSFNELGIKRARALIDDVNLPSIKLHEAAGFQRQEGRFMIYRKYLAQH